MKTRERSVGLVDIARIAGVSPATVSRALANSPVVAEATRVRLQSLAREHGFRLNQTASALRRRRTGAIGVVIPLGHERGQALSDPFFMGLIAPLADALAEAGYDLLLSRVIPVDGEWLGDLVDSGRVDGVIVIGQSDQVAAIEETAARYQPLVVWGARLPGARQLSVGTDNVEGGRLAAEHLIARGRTRLAFLGNPDVPEFAARLSGFRAAVAASVAAGRAVTEQLLPVHLITSSARQEIDAFLRENPSPDGIAAASDVIAMSAMQVLAERGLRVPSDVSVVGYDDVPVARYTTPPLTTVRQDLEEGARLIVDRLIRRLRGEPVEAIEMTPVLVVRGSA